MIDKSVGINGSNLKSDVLKIVKLLNKNRHLLIAYEDLPDSGEYGAEIGRRIELFQRRVVTQLAVADGRVDPNGQTLTTLVANARDVPAEDLTLPLFPLLARPTASYSKQGRAFRARRSRTRLHAACDMIAPVGTPVRAMADGTVIQPSYPFYSGTDALEVDHGTFIARYGEIRPGSVPSGLDRRGAVVSKGEVIAAVGQLNSGASMLHLEMYSGTETGGLTVRANAPFQRRPDLLNPTDYLDIATLEITDGSQPTLPQDVEVREPAGRKYGVTNDVETRLRVRDQPGTSAAVMFHIGRGTMVTYRATVVGGEYSFQGQPRDDWARIEYLSQEGYVGAAYIEPVEPPAEGGGTGATARALNGILFEFEPAGASDGTARQDRLPQQGIRGVPASESMAETDRNRVEALKDRFTAAALPENLPPALLAAIASRESRCGNVLDHNGFGDGGHGYGIMQIDDRSWSADMSEGADGLAHILQAAGILALKLEGTEHIRGLDTVQSLVTATSRYNGGRGLPSPRSDLGTTGGDYANDVWARARYYAKKIDWG